MSSVGCQMGSGVCEGGWVVMGLVPIINMPSVTKSIDDGFASSISSMSPMLFAMWYPVFSQWGDVWT